jgi:hypothetical protein
MAAAARRLCSGGTSVSALPRRQALETSAEVTPVADEPAEAMAGHAGGSPSFAGDGRVVSGLMRVFRARGTG